MEISPDATHSATQGYFTIAEFTIARRTFTAEREGAEALVRRASTRRIAERPTDALGAAAAAESWTPAKEEVAAIIVEGFWVLEWRRKRSRISLCIPKFLVV
jgi:hypothetical protein